MHIYKDNDGQIKQVLESDVVTLEQIDSSIGEFERQIATLRAMREQVVELQQEQPSVNIPEEPVVVAEPTPVVEDAPVPTEPTPEQPVAETPQVEAPTQPEQPIVLS